jgi:hypothetical protein
MVVIGEGYFGKTELRLYVAIDKTGGANPNAFTDPLSQ